VPSAAILAGGRASRFGGRDKSALIVNGRTILDRQLSALDGWPISSTT
jgi:molybdopterin-guanine dinucleotide biosynthesis protein A